MVIQSEREGKVCVCVCGWGGGGEKGHVEGSC